MKTTLIIVLSLLLTSSFAQNWIDLANVYWRTSPFNAIEGSTDQRNMNMYVVDLKVPVVLNDNNVLIFGAEYQNTQITSPTSNSLVDLNFSSSMLQVGWEHKWNQRSKMLFMSMTRLNTDFKNISAKHLQQAGLLLGTTSRSDKFDWKYGLYYNAEFFGPMFVPVFGFNWKINEKWRFKLAAPINLEVSYQPKNWFITGLRFDGVNASYRAEVIPGGIPWQEDTYIDKADNNAWLYTEFHLGKNIWFQAKAGYSVIRKYRIYSGNERLDLKLGPVNLSDDRPEVTPLFKNGWSFETRFIYRLPLKD